MKDNRSIPISDLRLKRKELVAISEQAKAKYEDAQEKIKHIDFVLGQFSDVETESAPATLFSEQGEKRLTVNEAIIKVLKDSLQPLETVHIFQRVLELGTKTTRGSFNVSLNRLLNSPNSPIKRTGAGVYGYAR